MPGEIINIGNEVFTGIAGNCAGSGLGGIDGTGNNPGFDITADSITNNFNTQLNLK